MILFAIIAGICMLVQDTLAIIKFQAASRNQGVIAAIVDVFLWGVTITGTTIAAFTFHGHDTSKKWLVIGAVAMGTIIGNLIGTKIGKKLVKDTRLNDIEMRLLSIESSIHRNQGK